MSALLEAARPGPLLGDRPERVQRVGQAALDRRMEAWLAGRLGRRLTLAQFAPRLQAIGNLERRLPAVGSAAFRRHAVVLARSLRRQGVTEPLLLQVFAATRAAIADLYGVRLHDEQLLAGWVMLHGCVAEMQTGEGKTLTGTLPAMVMALAGTPVHVVTVNDYLVRRDAEALAPLYQRFGLRTAMVLEDSSNGDRRRAYSAPVVYCTSKQLVFDYLRDLQLLGESRAGLKGRLRTLLSVEAPRPVMRGLCFAIIDEADAILVDDARTPLILAQPAAGERDRATEAAVALSIARTLHEGVDFRFHENDRRAYLTDAGRDALARLAGRLKGVWRFERYRVELIRQALTALHGFRRDRDYLVKEGAIQLIDESTGRLLQDRKLQHGLHRMLEVKERCRVTEDNEVVASISFQRFFARYRALAGMSGTVHEVRGELRQVYGLEVVRIPPHRPCRRATLPPIVLPDREAQLAWAVADVARRQATGQPVLIGTRTVEMSERVSALLDERGISHALLNARQDAEEAGIIARAGQGGSVTVATNMAGRGTDIPLDDTARECGGLHVVCLEINDSLRVARQLSGRSGRQGDPGSAQEVISLEDELLHSVVPTIVLKWALKALAIPGIGTRLATWTVQTAQRIRERRHKQVRMRLYNGTEALERQLAIGGDAD